MFTLVYTFLYHIYNIMNNNTIQNESIHNESIHNDNNTVLYEEPILKEHTINIINNLNDINIHIIQLLKKNEECIIYYIERHIYIAILPEIIKTEIQLIFDNIYKQILNTF